MGYTWFLKKKKKKKKNFNFLSPPGPHLKFESHKSTAAAIVYLSSAAGSYVTGKILEVDGGIEAPTLPLGLPDL